MTFATITGIEIPAEKKNKKNSNLPLDIHQNIVYNKTIVKRTTNKQAEKGEMQNETLQHEQLGKGSGKPDG